MKNKLSFEILKIIFIAFLISLGFSLFLNVFEEIYFDERVTEKKQEINKEFIKNGYYKHEILDRLDDIDDSEDAVEIIINVLAIVLFSFVLYIFINKKVKYITDISDGLSYIGGGNLNYKIPVYGKNEIADLAININNMTKELKFHLEKEQKSIIAEQQLITGLTHDLRTPLSAIIGYLYVIKDRQYKSDEERDNYIEIMLKKSIRLQKLMDTLLEISMIKEEKNEMTLTKVTLEDFINHYLLSFKEELSGYGCEVYLSDISKTTKEIQDLKINTMYTFRVIENIVSNIIKYAKPKSEIGIEIIDQKEYLEVRFRNKCDSKTAENAHLLIDRFYKIDQSRQEIDSSGLGLAICNEIMKKQKGYIKIEGNKESNILTVILGFQKYL